MAIDAEFKPKCQIRTYSKFRCFSLLRWS